MARSSASSSTMSMSRGVDQNSDMLCGGDVGVDGYHRLQGCSKRIVRNGLGQVESDWGDESCDWEVAAYVGVTRTQTGMLLARV
jgi:hypothetical protein